MGCGVGVGWGVGVGAGVGTGNGVGKITGVAVGCGVGIGNGVGKVTGVGVEGKVTGVAVGCGVAVAMPATAVAIFASVVASISWEEGPQATSAMNITAVSVESKCLDILCSRIMRIPLLLLEPALPLRLDR